MTYVFLLHLVLSVIIKITASNPICSNMTFSSPTDLKLYFGIFYYCLQWSSTRTFTEKLSSDFRGQLLSSFQKPWQSQALYNTSYHSVSEGHKLLITSQASRRLITTCQLSGTDDSVFYWLHSTSGFRLMYTVNDDASYCGDSGLT